jgi:murein DD-endopeptidase MepM/ murein hydrolase activator NlpD
LRSDIQSAKNRLETLDQSVSRLKSFAQKLKVIGQLDAPQSSKALRGPVPGFQQNQGGASGMPTNSGEDTEDSGSIEDPDKQGASHKPNDPALYADVDASPQNIDSQMELSRTRSLMSELGQEFEAQTLTDQVSRLTQMATDLKEQADSEELVYAELQELFQDRVDRLLRTPSIKPAYGYLSSDFGYRFNPFSGRRTFHAGTDIANSVGTPIVAPAEGIVTYVGSSGGFGLVVRIDHGYNLVTKYGHTSKVFVTQGQRVKRGDKIANIGSSGRSTGPHLHYQVEVNGKPVNPRFFMLDELENL